MVMKERLVQTLKNGLSLLHSVSRALIFDAIHATFCVPFVFFEKRWRIWTRLWHSVHFSMLRSLVFSFVPLPYSRYFCFFPSFYGSHQLKIQKLISFDFEPSQKKSFSYKKKDCYFNFQREFLVSKIFQNFYVSNPLKWLILIHILCANYCFVWLLMQYHRQSYRIRQNLLMDVIITDSAQA